MSKETADAYKLGYKEGYEDGYDDGYDDGLETATLECGEME